MVHLFNSFINQKHRIKISPVGKAILDFLGKLGNFDTEKD